MNGVLSIGVSIKRLIVTFLIAFTLTSCNWLWDDVDEGFDITGTWLLVGGDFHFDNLDDNSDVIVVTNHFYNGSLSSLNIDGLDYPIEELDLRKTNWTFYPYNRDEFWLNDDHTHPYALDQFTRYQFSIFEFPVGEQQLGGSAKPITILYATDDLMTVRIQETYGSINDETNVRYWSTLEFEKVASW